MPDGKIVQTLKEFVATANKGNYKDEKELMSYFPELKSYDTNLLKEFVATANNGKYKDENELFSYFPEFESKKKESVPFISSDTKSQSPFLQTPVPEWKPTKQFESEKFASVEHLLQKKASADNYVKMGLQVKPGMRDKEIEQLQKSLEESVFDADYYAKKSQEELQSLTPNIQKQITPFAGGFTNKSNGIIDYDKMLLLSKKIAEKNGGGEYVSEVIYNQFVNQEQSKKLEPSVIKNANEILKKEKKVGSIEELTSGILKGKGVKTIEGLVAGIDKLLLDKKIATEQQIGREGVLAQTEYKQEEKKALEKYKPALEQAYNAGNQDEINAITEQYYTDLKGIQRKINARVSRTREELIGQFNAEISKYENISKDTIKYLNDVFNRAYKKAVENDLELKRIAQNAQYNFMGFGGMTGKAFVNGFLSTMTNIGAGLVGMGMGGGLSDYLRSLQSKADAFETVDLEVKGKNIFNPQTYAVMVGKQLGYMAPTIAMAALTKNPYLSGTAQWFGEQFANAGDVYNQTMSETGNPVKAQQASKRYLNNNIPTIPLYFLEADLLMKATGLKKGNKLLSFGTEVLAIEPIQELPSSYLQQAESVNAKPLKKWLKEDAPEIYGQTVVSSAATMGFLSGLGKLAESIKTQEQQQSLQKNYFYNLLNTKGQNAAFSVLEIMAANGGITNEQLMLNKENLAKVQTTIQELKQIGLTNVQVEGYLALLAERDTIRENMTKTSNPDIVTALEKKLQEKNKQLEEATSGKVKATTVQFSTGSKITIVGEEPSSVMNRIKEQLGTEVTIQSTDEKVNEEANEIVAAVPQQENTELQDDLINTFSELYEAGINTVEENGTLIFYDEEGNRLNVNNLPEQVKAKAIELQNTFAKMNGNNVVESIEVNELARQYAPVTDEMVVIEKEFAAQGYKIETDYDNEVAVYDSKGNLLDPEELPEGLRFLASRYELATQMLGDLNDSAREIALKASRGKTEDVEAEIVALPAPTPKSEESLGDDSLQAPPKGEAKQGELELGIEPIKPKENAVQKPSTKSVLQRKPGKAGEAGSQRQRMEPKEWEKTPQEIKRDEEEKKLIQDTATALKEKKIQESKEGKAIYALVPKKFHDKTKKPYVQIAEAYGEAKKIRNSNPELIKAVEDFLNIESGRLPLDQKGRRVGNIKYKQGSTHIVGRSTSNRTPTGEKIKGRFKLVPASELVPSHNPITFGKNPAFPLNSEGKTINDRDYEKGEADRTNVVALAQTLDSRAIEQFPWVSKEGIVYNGNNRTMSRQLAAKNETDAEYIQELKEKASMYGFTEEQVDSMENPTLVFEPDYNLPFTTKTWKMFNAEEKKSDTPGAVAIKISKTISDKAKRELSKLYEEAETASDVTSDPKLFKTAIDILVQDGVIQSIEIPKYRDKGVATPEGVALLERVILGASLNESAIETLMSLSMGNIKKAILKNVVGLMQNATKGADSLIPDITGAISIIKKAKALKSSVVDYLVSFDIFGENDWTIGEMSLAILLDLESPAKLQTFLTSYNQDIGQQLMFGDSTKEGILNNLLTNIIPEYDKARKIIERVANRSADETGKGAEKPNLQATGTTTAPKNTISKERFSKLIDRIKKAFPKINIITSAKEFADKLKQYGIDAANLQALSSVEETAKALDEKFNPEFKNTIVEKLSKFDRQIKDKKFPSALEVAEHVLPRSIFNKYKKLYELAARNNITVSNERLPNGMVASWAYGNIQINKDVLKYYLENFDEFAETLNHEIIHGLISHGIRNNYALFTDLQDVMSQIVSKFNSASDEVKNIISYIQDTRNEFIEKDILGATEQELDSDKYREVGSLEELITYAFTNKEFADFLDSIPASKDIKIKGDSIFQQLKNIIRDFISKITKSPTALDEINSVLDKYFDTNWNESKIAERNKQYEWNLRFSANENILDKYNNNSKAISEAYHKAKADGSNPELVKAVEELLGKKEQIDAANLEALSSVEDAKSEVNFMRTPSGTIYGAQFPDGTIYINQEVINAETPIHELSHIWESMFPNEWKKGIELMRNSKGFKQALSEIQNNPFYADKTLQQQESEALNTLIGRKGEGYFQNEMLSKFKAWLRNLFIKIGEKLNIKISPDTKLNQFTDKVIGDILGGKEIKGELKGKEWKKNMPINPEFYTVRGVDLKVGGKGMKGFYDNIVPSIAKSLVKELTGQNVEVGETKIESLGKIPPNTSVADIYEAGGMEEFKKNNALITTQQSIDITPELKRQVKAGIPKFMASANQNTQAINDFDKLNKKSINEMNDFAKKYGAKKLKQLTDITSNFGTYISNLEKSNYIIDKKC